MRAVEDVKFPVRTSFWGTAEADPASELVGAEEADVVIIGAGLAGLSTAYHLALADPTCRVVVLEARYAGYGASGRNFCNVPQLARAELGYLERVLGPAEARFVVDQQAQMFDDFQTLLEREAIECEFAVADVLTAAMSEDMVSGLRRTHEQHKAYGFPSELLDRDEVRARVGLQALGGLGVGRNGYAQPFKLVRGLSQAALRRGVVLHEGSPLLGLARTAGGGIRARSQSGHITARCCVVATNAFSPGLGVGHGVVHPTYTYVVATEPLDAEQLALMAWDPRHRLVLDAGLNYYYMQLRPNGQLLMGGGGHPPAPADHETIPPHDNAAEFARIHEELLQRFPWLDRIAVDCAWGGPLGMTESRFPVTAAVAPGFYVNAGYNGRGVLMGTLSGRVLAGEIFGRESADPPYEHYGELLLRFGVDDVTICFEDER